MKKLSIAVALFAVSNLVHAVAACPPTTGTAGAGVPVPAGVSGTAFILQGFTPRCSTNVSLDWVQNARAVGVGAASSKGGFSFRGNSEGGAVAGTACGTNKRCTGAEAATEATTALAAAST